LEKGETPLNNKIRVYELAKKLNRSNKELMAVLEQLGIQIKTHMSSITNEEAQMVEEEVLISLNSIVL